jgi:copper chaperone CopZ
MFSGTPRTFIGSTTFCVPGLVGPQSRRALTSAIAAVDGVQSVTVEVATGTVTVIAARPVDRADIAAAVDEVGHTLRP